MKTIYINLDRDLEKNDYIKNLIPKAERLTAVDGNKETEESIKPFVGDPSWRDPFHNRRLTAGEVGCFLSHFNVWKKCIEENSPFLVLEDDIKINNPSYEEVLLRELQSHPNQELIYLSSKPMSSLRSDISEKLQTAGYSYWTSAYYLTVEGAKKLVKAAESTFTIIPVDEFIPACMGYHSQLELNKKYSFVNLVGSRFKENLIEPKQGAFNFSSTEYSPIWGSIKISVVTVATDESKASALINSSECPVINLGKEVVWEGGNMSFPGGGHKVNLFRDYLASDTLLDNQIVIFLDGYDTSIFSAMEDIVQRYLDFKKEVVFAAEINCWPDRSIAHRFSMPENGVPYLNSGCIIGTVRELRKILSKPIENHEDDQLYYQEQFLTNKFNACLDHEGWLFSCLSGVEDSVRFQNGQIHNTYTKCTSLVVHGNGGDKAKQKFLELINLNPNLTNKNKELEEKRNIRYLDRDIIVIDNFFSEDFCKKLIEEGESFNNWKPLDTDAYPGQEVRLRDLNNKHFIDTFYQAYQETIVPLVEKHWFPMQMHGIRDLFIIKYSMDGQKDLPLHHDMSLVSGSIKLNNDYEGAELVFPRQGISNKDLPVGSIVLWPSSVTHPHKCEELISGTKYSLTMWTARHAEDIEFR
jgi:hypothetical protein